MRKYLHWTVACKNPADIGEPDSETLHLGDIFPTQESAIESKERREREDIAKPGALRWYYYVRPVIVEMLEDYDG